MATRPVASIRVLPEQDRIEVTLRPGFTRAQLDVVRGLPGRRYDVDHRVWSAPGAQAALAALIQAFGADCIVSTSGGASPPPPGDAASPPDESILDEVRQALTLRGYSPRTRKVYLSHLRRFLAWCGEGSGRIPEDLADRGQAYLLELIERKRISKSYQNQVVSALRFMCESVLHQPALALSIPRPRKQHRLPAVLSTDEMARMLKKARNPKHRALLMILYSAGLRVGEVVRLTVGDLDMGRGMVRVRRGKGDKDRYAPLADRALKAVRIYRDAYPTDKWLFPGPQPGRHLTERSVQRIVKRAAKAAGIEKDVSTHTIRHSFATHLLEVGVSLRVIQEFLGHQSARTTQIYTHVAQTTLEAVRSPLDNLE